MKCALPIAAALAIASYSAQAAEKEERFSVKAVADKPAFVMDPAKAYILVESDAMSSPALMKRPSPEDVERDRVDRAEALADEHRKWTRRHAAWQSQMRSLAKSPKTIRRPEEPLEPTEENFGWQQYEQRHVVFIGPQNRFSKQGVSLYLHEVPPGEYIYYGNVVFNPNGGIFGTCLCMGTVSFGAEAGRVTVMGKLAYPMFDAIRNLPKEQRPGDAFDLPPGVTTVRILPPSPAAADARLANANVMPAKFRPVARMQNWYGLEIDRLMPIDDVFRYEGDRIVEAGAKPVS